MYRNPLIDVLVVEPVEVSNFFFFFIFNSKEVSNSLTVVWPITHSDSQVLLLVNTMFHFAIQFRHCLEYDLHVLYRCIPRFYSLMKCHSVQDTNVNYYGSCLIFVALVRICKASLGFSSLNPKNVKIECLM